MKLRKKTLIVLASCWILAFGLIALISVLIIETQFIKIERKFIDAGFARINAAVQNKITDLKQSNLDWSPWDDLYNYMQNKNPGFIKSSLPDTIHNDTKIELYLFLDTNGKVHYSNYFDIATQKMLNLPSDLMSLLDQEKLFFPKKKEDVIKGMLLLNNQVWFIVSSYILTSDKKSEPDGVFINGMTLNDYQLTNFSKATELPLQLITVNDANQDPALKAIFAETAKQGTYYQFTNNHVDAYVMLKDIFGKNIAMLSAKMPHDIYIQGKATITTYLVFLFFIAIFISFLIIVLLRRIIINRLELMEDQITHVDLLKNTSSRITISGEDELTHVANSVNNMLEVIEASQTDLENRVKKRTEELFISQKELSKNRERLKLARSDSLTGLPNRKAFYELLQESIKDAKRNNKKLAILFLDLDHFKNINDTMGHRVGDEVLIQVSSLLKKALRENDLLARLGGDEFIMCLKNLTDPTDARVVVEKIIYEFSKPLQLTTRLLNITPSIGISIYPDDNTDVETLVHYADLAMYRAKATSRNSYQFFTLALNVLVLKKLEMEYNLREAISAGQIEAYFQPVINLTDNSVTSVEALARWHHPVKGDIAPAEFILVAEETGLIHLLGELIVKDVAKKQKILIEKYGHSIRIAINFSAVQFNEANFIENIHNYIEKHELNPQLITIEITELAIMKQIDEAMKKLNALKMLGFHLAIDDFGTGHSSLSYLKNFNVDYIKIDKSFLVDIEFSAADQNIIAAIIFLGHSLGIKVIAEGVENNFALEFLKEKKCDMVQGFLFSRALPFSSYVDEYVNN